MCVISLDSGGWCAQCWVFCVSTTIYYWETETSGVANKSHFQWVFLGGSSVQVQPPFFSSLSLRSVFCFVFLSLTCTSSSLSPPFDQSTLTSQLYPLSHSLTHRVQCERENIYILHPNRGNDIKKNKMGLGIQSYLEFQTKMVRCHYNQIENAKNRILSGFNS